MNTSSTDEHGRQQCHFNENGHCSDHGGRQENYCDKHAHHFNVQAARVHKANTNWWVDIDTGMPVRRNVGELIALCHSELSEALEGHRKNLMDDKLPHRKMFEVELADCVIRILDIAGGLGLDLGGAYEEKMSFNAVRHDHTIEGRKAADGKKY